MTGVMRWARVVIIGLGCDEPLVMKDRPAREGWSQIAHIVAGEAKTGTSWTSIGVLLFEPDQNFEGGGLDAAG